MGLEDRLATIPVSPGLTARGYHDAGPPALRASDGSSPARAVMFHDLGIRPRPWPLDIVRRASGRARVIPSLPQGLPAWAARRILRRKRSRSRTGVVSKVDGGRTRD